MEPLLAHMRQHGRVLEVVQATMACFSALSVCAANRAALVAVVPASLAAMEQHAEDLKVAWCSSECLWNLSVLAENRGSMCDVRVVAAVRHALVQHAGSANVVRSCVGCLRNLASYPGAHHGSLTLAVPVLHAAMDRHAGDAEVVLNAVGLLWNLAVRTENRVALKSSVPLVRAAQERHAGNSEVTRCCRGFLTAASASSLRS
jgi:hypothetical protein